MVYDAVCSINTRASVILNLIQDPVSNDALRYKIDKIPYKVRNDKPSIVAILQAAVYIILIQRKDI